MKMALGPLSGPYSLLKMDAGTTVVAKSAPVPRVACTPRVSPMVGRAAVPAIRSFAPRMTLPRTTRTWSPTRLWSWASVAGPRTIWPGLSSPWPDRIRGPTAGRTGESMAGTVSC